MASQAIIANQRSLGGGGSGIKINAAVLPVLPSSATKGTIVVVSSTSANKFYFGYTMPPSPVAGDVWIQTIDTALGYPFLVGTVTLKPGATMQYTGSEWEYRNAYIGLNGKWEIFSTFSPLSALTWEQIDSITASGEDPSKFWAVGETKSITISGEAKDFEVELAGINHDNLADGNGKAGLTFGLKNSMDALSIQTAGGTADWFNCSMRTTTLPGIKSRLPLDLQSVIRPVEKLTTMGGSSANVQKGTEELFLYSETEISGSTSYSAGHQGDQYPIFATVEARIKRNNTSGSTVLWWTRSPRIGASSVQKNFVVFQTNGVAYYNATGSYSSGVVFGFCVGGKR